MVGLSASLGTTARKRGQIGKAKKHDCGEHGKLTVSQIAGRAGITTFGIYQRIRDGVTGAALCDPAHDRLRRQKSPCSRPVILAALKLATRFPDRLPTVDEIIATHPMSKGNAVRWRYALDEARRGIAA